VKPITLYVKTHNKTGLKYFGKCQAKDVFKYKGSGKYWQNHIKLHGYDVSTEIIGVYFDYEEAKKISIEFSIKNNITESNEWANLKLESLDGGWDYVNTSGKNGYYNLTNEQKLNFAKLGGTACYEQTKGIHALSPEEKKKSLYKDGVHIQHLKETRLNTVSTNQQKYGVDYPTQLEEVKAKIKKSLIETYGEDNPMRVESVKEQHKNSILEKYGVENISQSVIIKEKKKKHFIEKYGVSCNLNTEEVKEKARKKQKEKRSRDIVKKLEHLRDSFGVKLPKNYALMKDEKLNYLYITHTEIIKEIKCQTKILKHQQKV
jgi:hypothetical protein